MNQSTTILVCLICDCKDSVVHGEKSAKFYYSKFHRKYDSICRSCVNIKAREKNRLVRKKAIIDFDNDEEVAQWNREHPYRNQYGSTLEDRLMTALSDRKPATGSPSGSPLLLRARQDCQGSNPSPWATDS